MTADSVLITGTTSGIGRALLDRYSRARADVVAISRRRLPSLESQHPSVRFETVDVRSADEVGALVDGLATTARLPDTFILNAGINRVDNNEVFDLASYKAVIDTNLYGVLNFVEALTRLAPSTKRAGTLPRRVVAISSMAAFVGSPYGLGYHTSKRALTACFDVWSTMYADTDLLFQQVILGPVPTGISTIDADLPAWMIRTKNAGSVSADAAARAIARFATTGRARLYYPKRAVPLFLGMWLGRSLLPDFLQGKKTLGGNVRRAGEPRLGSDSDED